MPHKLINWDAKSPSQFQFKVKQFLKTYWQFHQVYEEYVIKGKLRVDFLNKTLKIAVESSGGQHFTFNKFFHSNNRLNFGASVIRDDKKRIWLEKNGYSLIELTEKDLPNLSVDYIREKFGIDIT